MVMAGFSPDGRFRASSNEILAFSDKPVLTFEGTPDQVTFNANSTIVAARDGRVVTLWEIAGKQRLARLAHSNIDSAVAFSRDGEHLATTDGTFVRIWKTDGREVAKIEHLGKVAQVAFSPEGDLLSFAPATPEGESAIHLLLWRPEQLTSEACQRLTRNLTADEWREYVGAETYRKTCPNLR